jgi:hypothetical protein
MCLEGQRQNNENLLNGRSPDTNKKSSPSNHETTYVSSEPRLHWHYFNYPGYFAWKDARVLNDELEIVLEEVVVAAFTIKQTNIW